MSTENTEPTTTPQPQSASIPPPPQSAPVPAPPQGAPVPPPPPAAPGAYSATGIAMHPDGKPAFDASGRPTSPKSRLAAAILAWFLGFLGIHRFYVGKIGTAILMIVTLGGLGIWVLIDFIIIVIGNFKDKEGRVLANW